MATIAEQIQNYQSALTEAKAKGDEAVSRKIAAQIEDLKAF
ncbi:MAG: hypothetical protein ACKO6F_08605 [Cyanobium sp.]